MNRIDLFEKAKYSMHKKTIKKIKQFASIGGIRLGFDKAFENANFIYKVSNIDDDIMNTVNAIDGAGKIKNRMKFLQDSGADFTFCKVDSKIFSNNLELIDSFMPKIMSYVMLYRYRDNIKMTLDILDRLCQDNPLNYDNNQIYRYKYKKLVCAAALGMLPATQWDGIDEANGGYVIVKNDGDIVAYYLYNRNFFEEYLLKTTYLESASTSKHNYAKVYKKDGKYFINLNLQIRFKA